MKSFIALLLSTLTASGCSETRQNWPDDGKKQIELMLNRGPKYLDCYESKWMKSQDNIKYSWDVLKEKCVFSPKNVTWFVYEDVLNGVTRCDFDGYTSEFSVQVFRKANNRFGGSLSSYFCSMSVFVSSKEMAAGETVDIMQNPN